MSNAIESFGSFFKSRRIELGYTLRRFCQKYEHDPANLSRMERGLLPPPQKRGKLEEYTKQLELKEGSDEWYQFFDLAHIASGTIPEEILDDSKLVGKLPILFRTIRGQKATDEQLDALIEKIRRA